MVGRFAGDGSDVGFPFAFTDAAGDAVGVIAGAEVGATAKAGEDVGLAAGTVKTTPTTGAWVGPRVVEPVGWLGCSEPAVAEEGDGSGAGGSPTGESTTAGTPGGGGRSGEWTVGPPRTVLSIRKA